MVNDQLGGVAGGFAGTAAMLVFLFVADAVSGFQIRSIEAIALIVGAPGNFALGLLLFAAAGVVVWPLLFVSLVQFLPGGSDAVRGAVFASVLWLSFAFAFGSGLGGVALALYLAFTLLAHWLYGLVLGAVYDRLAEHATGVV